MMDMGMNAELERDGGSEGEALSTEGSSAGSMYCSLEQDYHRIMTEMKTNESLATYEAEYTRIYEALYKSNQQGVELERKINDLKDELQSNTKMIQHLETQSKTDSTSIKELSAELLEFKKLADVAHKREQRAQEIIGNLRVSITKLTDELDQKNKQLAVDESVSAQKQKDGAKDKDILLQEIDTMKHRLKTLTAYNTEIDQKYSAAEATISELQDKLNKMDVELSKEHRARDACETELQSSYEERRQRLSELQAVEDLLKTTNLNHKKLEELLKEQVVENDKQAKEIKRLNSKIINLRAEVDKTLFKNETIRKEAYEKGKAMKEMTKEILKQREEISKQKSEKDNAMKKLMKERADGEKIKEDLNKANSNLKGMRSDNEELKKTLDSERKVIEKLNRERDVVLKNNTNLEDLNKKYVIEIHVLDQTNRKLDNDLEESAAAQAELNRILKNMEKERDRNLMDARDLTIKVEDYMDEVKMLRLEISDYQKRLIEAEAKYRQQMTLFEEVRSERNAYKKNFSLAQEELGELKEKLKSMNVQNHKLEEQLALKTAELLKQEFLYNKLEKEKDNVASELQESQKVVHELRRELNEMRQEEKRQMQQLRERDLMIGRQKKEIESIMNERDVIGTQIVRRNDEVNLAYNKIQLLTGTLTQGEKQYSQRMQEIRMLKLEVKKLRMEKAALLKHTRNLADLRGEVFNLERNLTKERIKVVALEEEIQNPLNIHRWRNLEGTDPESFEQLTKIQFLQKRILKMSSEMVAKEKQIKDTEKLYMNLRELIAKQPGPELLVTLTKTRKALRDRGNKMKCLVAELNMSLKTEHNFELSKVKKELNMYKSKYLAQKKKICKPCEPIDRRSLFPPCPPIPDTRKSMEPHLERLEPTPEERSSVLKK